MPDEFRRVLSHVSFLALVHGCVTLISAWVLAAITRVRVDLLLSALLPVFLMLAIANTLRAMLAERKDLDEAAALYSVALGTLLVGCVVRTSHILLLAVQGTA